MQQEMNQCYMAREQDTNSTPACDGCCQIGFLFFLRMWNIYITSSIGCRGEQPFGAAVTTDVFRLEPHRSEYSAVTSCDCCHYELKC